MSVIRYRLDPQAQPPLGPDEEARLDALSDAAITEAAQNDPDNPPLSEAEFARIHAVQLARRVRRKLGLSQTKFAERFEINPARLRDWEQGRFQPDSVAMAYLRVIEHDPKVVQQALAKSRR